MQHCDDDELLDTKLAAAFIGHSDRTMERWRLDGKGPAYVKFGKLVKYRKSSLRAYIRDLERQSTTVAA